MKTTLMITVAIIGVLCAVISTLFCISFIHNPLLVLLVSTCISIIYSIPTGTLVSYIEKDGYKKEYLDWCYKLMDKGEKVPSDFEEMRKELNY